MIHCTLADSAVTQVVVWKINPLFAEWLAASSNCLWSCGILRRSSTVLELGCGISPIIGLVLSEMISSYVLTDQAYVAKLVERNIAENMPAAAPCIRSQNGASLCGCWGPHCWHQRQEHLKSKKISRRKSRVSGGVENQPQKGGRSALSQSIAIAGNCGASAMGNIVFQPLDWEMDVVTADLTGLPSRGSFDAVVACDCVYNEALIEPFVQTCADACRLRTRGRDDKEHHQHAADCEGDKLPTCCIVAQQLRNYEVFEAWLAAFHRSFRVWRLSDAGLPEKLKCGSGYVIHLGFLRESHA